jgi:hypothetical protein
MNPARARELPSSAPSSTHENKSSSRLNKLTPEERAILRANNGCFKCRRPNAGHLAKDCPGDASWNERRPHQDNRRNKSSSQKPVAAIINDDTFESSSVKSAPRAEVIATSTYPIAAILPPPNESGVLESEGEDSDNEVGDSNRFNPLRYPPPCLRCHHGNTCDHVNLNPCLDCYPRDTPPRHMAYEREHLCFVHAEGIDDVPLSVPHFRWRAAVDNANGVGPARQIVDTLIDNGSHLVVIADKLVSTLGLRRHKLHKHQTLGG